MNELAAEGASKIALAASLTYKSRMDHLLRHSSTQTLKSVMINGIIQNGSYFLSDIPIYEDGIVDCWGCVDLPLFKKKIESQWVVPKIENGSAIRISQFGDIEILNAEWAHRNGKDLFKYVKGLVKTLNPSLTNLYDMKGSDTYRPAGKRFDTYKISRSKPNICKPETDMFSTETGRASLTHFVRENGIFYYVKSSIFQDETLVMTGMPSLHTPSLAEFREKLSVSDDYGFPKSGDQITIEGLVTFTAGGTDWFLDRQSLIHNLDGALREIRGEPSLVDVCREAFDLFQTAPTEDNLDLLRTAYENVPDHERMFCGGQDKKDIPIRIALYGEAEIENWSHWQVARTQGLKLPTITTPKVIDPER